MVDCGFGRDVGPILREIEAAGLSPARVKHLLLTHSHADHAGGAYELREQLGLQVAADTQIAAWIRDGDEVAIDLKPARDAGLFPAEYRFQACPVDLELQDEDVIQVGRLRVRAIRTPGHSAGHMSFLLEEAGRTYLFAGDCVFYGGKILLLNFPDCSLQAYLQSLRRLGKLAVDILLPGHSLVALNDGQMHINTALEIMDRCAVPPGVL